MTKQINSRAPRQIILIFCLVLPCFFIPSLTTLAQTAKIPEGWKSSYVYANGIRIHYYHISASQGKPVMIMSHGVTDNGLCWTTLTKQLMNLYDIYMVDSRGHGLSDPFTQSDDGETMVKDLVEFVKAMKFDKPILMGHSMGAATVMRVGAEYPGLARAIIMLDPYIGSYPRPAPGADTSRGTPAASAAAKPSAPNRLSVNMFGSPEVLVTQNNYNYEDLVATGRRQFPKWADEDVQYWALSKKQYHGAYTPEALAAMRGLMKTDNALATIKVPALVLKADASPEARKRDLENARVMQKGKLIHVDDSGHNLHHDQLDKTVELLMSFLATLPSN